MLVIFNKIRGLWKTHRAFLDSIDIINIYIYISHCFAISFLACGRHVASFRSNLVHYQKKLKNRTTIVIVLYVYSVQQNKTTLYTII